MILSSDPGFFCPKEAEMVWAQLQVVGSKSINICSFYRPPNNSDTNYIKALTDVVAQIDTSVNHVWIAGDFNLGDIDWETSSVNTSTPHSTIAEQLLDLANDHGLTQMVDKPTRTTATTSNILDIFMTSSPDMVNRCEVIPGISDHDIPLLDVSTRVLLNKRSPRKILQYHKANFEGLVKSLADFSTTFCRDFACSERWDVEAMWEGFKHAILKAMDEYIPTKLVSARK